MTNSATLEKIFLEWPVFQYITIILLFVGSYGEKCDKNPWTSESEIMNVYENLPMGFGYLAFSWNKHNVLGTVFDYEEMMKVYENRLSDMINLGCLVKYHLSHALEKSSWSFTHLTFQEYFLAFYLSNTESEVELKTFTESCTNVYRMEEYKIVFQFLCWINAYRANSLLKELVQKFSTKAESIRLLPFLMDLVPEYQEASFMKLPLPTYVEITPKVDMKRLLPLSMSDCTNNTQIMSEIQLKIVPELLHCFAASYVKQMSVNINTEENINKVKRYFQTAVKLTRAEIRFNKLMEKFTESGKQTVISSLVRQRDPYSL